MLQPEQIAKTTEHSHQAAFFCWLNQQTQCPHLRFSHAIPNGGLRNKVQASRLKAEGVKAGVPDVFIPYPIHLGDPVRARAGLYIEFKKPGTENRKEGGLSKEQIEWREYLQSVGYEHKVAYSWLQATEQTINCLTH